MTTLPPGRDLVRPDQAAMEMALHGDAYVHVRALPEIQQKLWGTGPLSALLRQRRYRARDAPTIPACLAGPNAPGSPS